jgi:ATP-dependent Clp protease ATP-binding subunit ClpA
MTKDDKEVARNLERDLKTMVFDQDVAIDRRSPTAIKMARAGLRDPEKPIGSYLFSGPTGVGKTEVARQLAKTSALSSSGLICPNIWSVTPSHASSERLRAMSVSNKAAC